MFVSAILRAKMSLLILRKTFRNAGPDERKSIFRIGRQRQKYRKLFASPLYLQNSKRNIRQIQASVILQFLPDLLLVANVFKNKIKPKAVFHHIFDKADRNKLKNSNGKRTRCLMKSIFVDKLKKIG